MPDPRPQAVYTCSQSELYAICLIGWTSFEENLADFSTFKTIYTAVYGTDAKAELDAAVNLPGFQERNEAAETAYIQMAQAHAECIMQWKSLRSYIKSAFPTELQKPKIESAGYDHYSKAANKNWDETIIMLTAGQHFIDNNTAELVAGGMPPTFAPEYLLITTAFKDLYVQFTDFEQDEQEETDTKIVANNALYKKLLSMFEDAQIIYEHNPSKPERFIFAQIKAMITTKPGSGTIPADTIIVSGKVVDATTLAPIANASVNATANGSTATFGVVTDNDGLYELPIPELPPQPADTSGNSITINAEALDFETESQLLNYVGGNRYELDFELQQSVEPTPEPEPTEPEPPVEP
jgi:hypothetical protein